jgi:phosphoribosylglycinamide formyltransferase-1
MKRDATVSKIGILISGRGSNMRALVEAGLPVAAVISNRADAAGLAYAQARGIETSVVEHAGFVTREGFDARLAEAIDRHAPDLVVLAGFMRILTDAFVHRYAGRMLNIHPSLLPAFPGLHTHARALETGVRIHGCTVHWVTPVLDSGPIIVQAAVPVRSDDTAETLAARVLRQEHVVYPRAVRWALDGQLLLEGNRVRVRNDAPQLIYSDE